MHVVQKLSYGQALLQCVYSPHAVHCIVGQPVPKFLNEKSVLGVVLVPVEVPSVGLVDPLSLAALFLPFLPLDPFPWP